MTRSTIFAGLCGLLSVGELILVATGLGSGRIWLARGLEFERAGQPWRYWSVVCFWLALTILTAAIGLQFSREDMP